MYRPGFHTNYRALQIKSSLTCNCRHDADSRADHDWLHGPKCAARTDAEGRGNSVTACMQQSRGRQIIRDSPFSILPQARHAAYVYSWQDINRKFRIPNSYANFFFFFLPFLFSLSLSFLPSFLQLDVSDIPGHY